MSVDFDVFAGFKTADLKAELAKMREALVQRQSTYADKMITLDSAVNDLKKMEEKADFVVTQLDEIAVLTTPGISRGEHDSNTLDRYFSDPMFMVSAGLSGLGGVVILSSPALKLVGKIPKLGGATKLANSGKFLKVLKFGKGIALFGAAIAILDLAFSMVSAQEINKQLRTNKVALQKATDEADAEIRTLDKAVRDASGQVRKLLKAADLSHLAHAQAMEVYVQMMNEAIGALSAQKAKVRMVRKMVMHAMMAPNDIAAITGVDRDVVDSISQRITIERALVAGKTIVQAGRDSGLDTSQIIEIERTVRARNEAVAGENAQQVADLLNVPVTVVQTEGEETLALLAPSWGMIETQDDLEAISNKALVSRDALVRLSNELHAKATLAGGADPATVAATAQRSLEHVAEWSADVAEGRAQIAILKRDGKFGKPETMAAQLRIPLSLIS